MQRRAYRCLVIFIFLVLSIPASWGHSGAVHKVEMLSVLGISPQDTILCERLRSTLDEFQTQIDLNWNSFYEQLKEAMKPANFTWGTYTHRLFFHWGFNEDPRNSKALQECMSAATSDPRIIERGYQCITKEQARRNRAMILAVGRLSAAQRKHLTAVATILYNTHIIGDYIEGTLGSQSAMISLDKVVEDIINHGVMNFDCSYDQKRECAKELRKACRISGGSRLKAMEILRNMQIHIPKCIRGTKIIKRIVYGNSTPISAKFPLQSIK